MRKTAVWTLILVLPGILAARDKQEKKEPIPQEQKVVRAVRTVEPMEIDGVLKENVWQGPAASDFVMADPVDGGTPTEKTEVWVAYDDANLYVAAYLHDSEPKSIRSLLGRRDDSVDSDWFAFCVDPYYDRRTGYMFAVNPAGSIQDSTLANDVNEDDTWDGIWDWKAQVNGDGWVVEMRVPLNQLRFPKKDAYVWGVDFRRVIKRKMKRTISSGSPRTRTPMSRASPGWKGSKTSGPDAMSRSSPIPSGRLSSSRPSEATLLRRGTNTWETPVLTSRSALKAT